MALFETWRAWWGAHHVGIQAFGMLIGAVLIAGMLLFALVRWSWERRKGGE